MFFHLFFDLFLIARYLQFFQEQQSLFEVIFHQDIFVFVEKTNRFNKSKFKNVKDIFEYETTEGKYTVLESLNGCGLNKYRLVKRSP